MRTLKGPRAQVSCSLLGCHSSPLHHVQRASQGPGWGHTLCHCTLVNSLHFQCSLQMSFFSADPFISVSCSEANRRRTLWGPADCRSWEGRERAKFAALGWLVLCWGEANLPAPCTTKEASQWRLRAHRDLTPFLSACTDLFTQFKRLQIRSFRRLLTVSFFPEPLAETNLLHISSHYKFNITAKERGDFSPSTHGSVWFSHQYFKVGHHSARWLDNELFLVVVGFFLEKYLEPGYREFLPWRTIWDACFLKPSFYFFYFGYLSGLCKYHHLSLSLSLLCPDSSHFI